MKEIDLNPWLIRMSQGDEEAFRFVYEATREHAYGLIYYLAPNKQDVGDIMNEVYMELLKSLDRYQRGQKFSSWFNGLIVRQIRNWKRKDWRRFRIFERLSSTFIESFDRASEEQMTSLRDRLELIPIMENLPLKLKEVVVLRYYQDCSLEEIGQLLNIPLGTVKSRHHNALKQMRHRFNQSSQRKENSGYVY